MTATLTVAVVTRNRARSLAQTLAAILAQDCHDDLAEVIVVDDQSVDHTRASAEAIAAAARLPVRVLEGPGRGIGAARNVALQACRTELLAFTDDDCLPCVSWARLLRDAVVSHPDFAAAAGKTIGGPTGDLFADFATYTGIHSAKRLQTGEVLAAPTANVIYRCKRALAVGGFDERLPSGEDTSLSEALRRRGWRIAWAPDALVAHYSEGGAGYLVKRSYQWGVDDARRRTSEPVALTAIRIAYRSRMLFRWGTLPWAWWRNETGSEEMRDRVIFPALDRLRASVHVLGEWRGFLSRIGGGEVDPARY